MDPACSFLPLSCCNLFYYGEGDEEVNLSEEIVREGKTTKKKEEETKSIVSCQNLPIHLKLCHFLTYEVVVSLGLMSSVVIVGGGGGR